MQSQPKGFFTRMINSNLRSVLVTSAQWPNIQQPRDGQPLQCAHDHVIQQRASRGEEEEEEVEEKPS